MKDKYRIVSNSMVNNQKPYRVEIKKWYFPIWLPAHRFGVENLHCTIYGAEQYAVHHSKKKTVVKILDI